MTLTGAQVRSLLETQSAGYNGQTQTRVLQVSVGFSYAYQLGAACNARVGSIALGGQPVEATSSVRVTVNSFLADVGDGFVILKEDT